MSTNKVITLAPLIKRAWIYAKNFAEYACKRGKKKELVVSTTLLAVSLYLHSMLALGNISFVFPIFCYAGYWGYIWLTESTEDAKISEIYWEQEDWWWSLDGWQFEEEVSRIFKCLGYTVEVTKKTGDGGIDLLMKKDGDVYAVQCKHWKNPVSVMPLRELNGVKEDTGATKLIMIASGGVTKAALDFVKNKDYFQILDLKDIICLSQEAKA